MGTNYYIKDFEDPDEDGPGWHIGKQSAGNPWIWADPPEIPTVVDAWLTFAWERDLTVVDEYGNEVSSLWDFVNQRENSDRHQPGKGWC